MHSVRRAAFRAASSSSSSSIMAAAASRQQAGSFAMQFTKAVARPSVSMPARYFSQTARLAQEQTEENEQSITENAIKSAENLGSTQETATLESSPTMSESAAAADGTVVYVGNVTFDATEVHFQEAFSKYGKLDSVAIGRDARGLSRGFAFVTFAEKSAADRAVAETNRSFWHGRRITVELRKPKVENGPRVAASDGEPTRSLYIGNIPYETSDADLNRLFRELDNVTDVRVAVDRNTGWPRGFAHADFADIESAIKAYKKLQTVGMGGRRLRIDYAGGKTARDGDRGGRYKHERHPLPGSDTF